MVRVALQAADELAAKGISAEVINLRSIRPLDRDTILESVKRTSRLLTLEEGWPQSGVGAEIHALVNEGGAFDFLDAPPARVCGADVPMPYAANLEAKVLPQKENVVATAERLMYRKKK
jgi:pyruvate dehydrogenase E1 component beta subunit